MAVVRKTITVTDQQDAWINDQVQAGRFTNDSELIRDLIRREQERGAGLRALVEHDRWFREQVQEALEKANAPGAEFQSLDDVAKQVRKRAKRLASG